MLSFSFDFLLPHCCLLSLPPLSPNPGCKDPIYVRETVFGSPCLPKSESRGFPSSQDPVFFLWMAQKYVLLIVFFALSSEVAIILKNIQLWPTNTGETKGGRNLPDGATEKKELPEFIRLYRPSGGGAGNTPTSWFSSLFYTLWDFYWEEKYALNCPGAVFEVFRRSLSLSRLLELGVGS